MGKIMVVHSEESILDEIQDTLNDAGYAVTLTSDPQRALSKAIANRFRLIIVDRHIGVDCDGGRLVELMRKYGIQSPIIGTATDGQWDEDSEELVEHVLRAPLAYGDLLRVIADLLEPGTQRDVEAFTQTSPELQKLLEGALDAPLDLEELDPLPEPEPETDPEPLVPTRPDHAPARRREQAWEPPKVERKNGQTRVLVGDGSTNTRAAVEKSLSKSGHQVTACADGHQVIETMMFAEFDVLLIDLWMTGADGFETIETLRMSGVDIPIIITTAYITREMVQELAPHKIQRILVKPFSAKSLLEVIQEAVPT